MKSSTEAVSANLEFLKEEAEEEAVIAHFLPS